MQGRSFSGPKYRYGFNGKENDSETVGTGSGTQDYGMRIYNPALGRFLSVDPIGNDYPWNSMYAFAENEPISNIDIDGLEKKKANFYDVAKCMMPGQNKHRTKHKLFNSRDLKIAVHNFNKSIHKLKHKDDIEKTKSPKLPNKKNETGGNNNEKSSEPQGLVEQKKERDGVVTIPNFFTSYADGDVFKDKNSTEFHQDVKAGSDLMKKVDDVLKTFENTDGAEINITIGGGKDVNDDVKQKRGDSLKKALEDKGFKGKINVNTTNDNVPAVQIMGVDGEKKTNTKEK